MLFPVQQSRLLTMAPEHANVLLALNNSALYIGIAAGSSIGGLVIGSGLITALGPAGASFEALALGLLLLSLRWVPAPEKRGSEAPSLASAERSER